MSRPGKRVVTSRLLSSFGPHSVAAEAYRLLRTNLRFASVDAPLRAVAVTSALADEGKSLTAANLAICMAQAGVRTLLVDADLRKPGQHIQFMVQDAKGLTTALVGLQTVEEVILKSQIENLWFLMAGDKPPNPTELLQSASMQRLHSSLVSLFDFIVYDCPPVLPAVEAIDLGNLAGGAVVVVRADTTPKDAVKQAVEQLRGGHVPLLGMILNDVKASHGYGYYAYAYGD